MRSHLITCALLSCCCALAACGSNPRAPTDGGSDAGAPTDAAAIDAANVDAGPVGDAGVPTVRCAAGLGPYLIVTRDDALRTSSSVVARLPIEVTGAATGLAILSVDEVLDGAAVRSWDVASLRAPTGFDGTVTPAPGRPSPTTLFTAVTDADAAELAQCELDPWARGDGELVVRLRTNETGELAVICTLAVDYDGRGPEAMDLSCARGVPGWIGPRPSVTGTTTPVVYRLMDAPTLAHNSGLTLADGFVATSAMLRSTTATFPGETACAPPTEWTTTAGTHQLWRGTSSDETWSGPVAPGAEESANWLWQEPGSLPTGFCFPPGVGPPAECLRPTLSLLLRGTSSAGAWEWESDLFDCLAL